MSSLPQRSMIPWRRNPGGTGNAMQRRIRILLIEDDAHRIERLKSWLPSDFVVIEARSAGRAIGLLVRHREGELAGIMLDHDLQAQAITAEDRYLSGSDVVDLIVKHVEKDVPVFVHSTNTTGGPAMAKRLDSAGYWATQVPMYALTPAILSEWIDDVRDLHEDRSGDT